MIGKTLNRVVSCVLTAVAVGVASAADTYYSWTGGAGNNVFSDAANWEKDPATLAWNQVGVIDGLASGTTLTLGKDYQPGRIVFTNSPALTLDLKGHSILSAYNYSVYDGSLTVKDTTGVATNKFTSGSYRQTLGPGASLVYDGVDSVSFRITPTFPEDRSAQLVIRNGTHAVVDPATDSCGPLQDHSRILVDNASLHWKNNFFRNQSSQRKGWEIVAQNRATVTAANLWYLGSSDATEPVRLVATSGATIDITKNRACWQYATGVEAYCTNATLALNNTDGNYASRCKFVCTAGTTPGTEAGLPGSLNLRTDNFVRFEGVCTNLPSLVFAADAQDNVVLFTNVTCTAYPQRDTRNVDSLGTLARGTNNIVRLADSSISTKSGWGLSIFSGCGTTPSSNCVVEFSGPKSEIVSRGQDHNVGIYLGQVNDAVAASDRPHLRFKIPEGGFDDTPIRVELQASLRWYSNPVIEIVPDGVRYGEEPTYHPLIGFGEDGVKGNWDSTYYPHRDGNMEALNTISAAYLPVEAKLVISNNCTRKSVGVLLPVKITLSSVCEAAGGQFSATLQTTRATEHPVYCVYDATDRGTGDPADWANADEVAGFPVGATAGTHSFVPADGIRFVRFYTEDGDGYLRWTAAYEIVDNPSATAEVVSVGASYVSIDTLVAAPGFKAAEADVSVQIAEAAEEYGAAVLVKSGVRSGETVRYSTPGLAAATAYKFRVTVMNAQKGSCTIDGTFTTGAAETATKPVVSWAADPSADASRTVTLPACVSWGGAADKTADFHVLYCVNPNYRGRGFRQVLYSGAFVKTGDPDVDEGTAGIPAANVAAAGLTFAGNSYFSSGVTYKVGDNQTAAYSTWMRLTAGTTYRFVKQYDDAGLVRITDPDGAATEVISDGGANNITYGHYVPTQSGWHKLDLRVGNGTGAVGPTKEPFKSTLLAGLAWTDSPEVTSDSCTAANVQYWKRFENGDAPVFFIDPPSLQEPVSDVVLAADTIGAVDGKIADLPPGKTYMVCLYAQNVSCGTSETTDVRAVTVPGPAALVSASATSSTGSYTVSGEVAPGLGETKVYLRWGFDGTTLDNEETLLTLSVGEDGAFSKRILAPQTGSALYWQVVVSNAYSCTTWGDSAWGIESVTVPQLLTDAAKTAWTWQTAGAGDWETAGSWSATGKTGFPNATTAQALFTSATSGAKATLKDDVTLDLLKVTGAKVTVDVANHLLSPKNLTFEKGANGESVDVTFENARFGATVNPTVPTDPGTAGVSKFTYRNSTAAFGDWSHPGNTAYVFDGGTFTWGPNYVRGESGAATSNRLVAAVNGAQVDLKSFAHIGSASAERPHTLIATDGASLKVGDGLNRTFLHSNIVVAVTNATFMFGNNCASLFADDSWFDFKDATVTGWWYLGRRARAYLTGDCVCTAYGGPRLMPQTVWDSVEDKARVGTFCSENAEILVDNATVKDAYSLAYVYGSNNVIRVKDSVVNMGYALEFVKKENNTTFRYGSGNRFIVDNSVITNTAHWNYFDVQTNVPNSAVVFCGVAPRYVVTGNGSGVAGQLGTAVAQVDPVELRFELPREGFAEAPLQFRAGKPGRIRAHLPLRVDASKYRRIGKYTVPLISIDAYWRDGIPTAAEITANLPAGALPKGSELVWVGNDLCLKMPSMAGMAVIIR